MLLTTVPTGAPPAAYSEAHGITCTLSRVDPTHRLFGHPTYSHGYMLRHTSHQRSQGHMPFPLTRLHQGSVLMCTTLPSRHSTLHRCLKVVTPASTFTSRNTRLPLVETVSMLGVTSCSHSTCTTRTALPTRVRMTATTHQSTHSSRPRHCNCCVQPNRCTTMVALWFGPLASAHNPLAR
jgi:hypothetical protein